MGLLNVTVSTTIAILYNLFVHHLTSIIFKNNVYQDKINRSIILILISGIIGVVMSKLLFKSKKKNRKSVVSNGLWLGGILLIVTSIFVNWQGLSDDIKLLMVGVTLAGLIYYSKHTLEYDEDEEDDSILDKTLEGELGEEFTMEDLENLELD